MEVVNKDGEIYRIDRIYEEKDKVTIIDFKTSLEEAFLKNYIDQITYYGTLISEIFPRKKIELKLLGILDGKIKDVK